MMDSMKHPNPKISYFALTNFRNEGTRFGIYHKDRIQGGGMVVLGKVGSGKTTLLKNILLQDILASDKRGVFVSDLHNDIIPDTLPLISPDRLKDVIHLDLPNPNLEYGYNPIRCGLPSHLHPLVASGILESFQKIWDKRSWGSRMESLLRVCILSLLSQRSANIADIRRILLDPIYRSECLKNISNPELITFWRQDFQHYGKGSLAPILSKINALLANPVVYNFLIRNKKQLSISLIMNKSKLLLVSLSRGQIGSDACRFIGGILLNAITVSGFSRASIALEDRKPFHLFLDEFSFYSTSATLELMSQLRKMQISALYSFQYLGQLDRETQLGLLGSVSTLVSFRVSSSDAKVLASEFYPVFVPSDLIKLSNHDIYLKMLISGRQSEPFSATTLPFPIITGDKKGLSSIE